MTEPSAILDRAERELAETRTLSDDTCRALAAQAGPAYKRALAFAGCSVDPAQQPEDAPTSRDDRVRAAKLMLLRLAADTGDPRWSSFVLDQLLDAAAQTPGGDVADAIQALFELSAQGDGELTRERANLLDDVVVGSFRRSKDEYQRADFSWAAAGPDGRLTPAQAYLLARALPDADLARLRDPIVDALKPTEFFERVRGELS